MGVGPNYRSRAQRAAAGEYVEPEIRYETVYKTLPNPDPKNFKIKDFMEVGKYLVAKVHYPDATNFEGLKVMVFEEMDIRKLINLSEIDPHFSKDKGAPIARFKPDDIGWQNAIMFCKALNGDDLT